MRVIVVGGGLAGLSCAHRLLRRSDGEVEPRVLEAAGRPGGPVHTEAIDGCRLEHGPEGFLDRTGGMIDLARDLDLETELVRARPEAKDRYLYKDGRLQPLPRGPLAFLRTGLLGLAGKVRLLAEPFVPPADREDETIRSFARRRIGPEAADTLVDAMVSGVFAGDPRKLSIRSAFPTLWQLEREHRSLFLGLLRRLLSGEGSGGGPSGPGGRLTSFREGMGRVVEALTAALGERLRTGVRVEGLEVGCGGVRARLASGKTVRGDRAVLAVPPGVTGRLVDGLPEARDLADGVERAPVAVVGAVWEEGAFPRPLDGFGFLVPGGEALPILGTLWSSTVFPDRAPEGRVLLRTMIGGARLPELVDLEDRALGGLARDAATRVLGARGEPRRVRVIRHRPGIPQYGVGHADRLEAFREALRRAGPLEACGWGYDGIGCNRTVASARRRADALLEETGGPTP